MRSLKGSQPKVEKRKVMARVTGRAVNATHAKPTNANGGEDGLAQHRGRNGGKKSREDSAAHGLHHAHAERKVSRLNRERKNPLV